MIAISSIKKLYKLMKDIEESKVNHKHFSAERGQSVFRREHLRCSMEYSGFKQKNVWEMES